MPVHSTVNPKKAQARARAHARMMYRRQRVQHYISWLRLMMLAIYHHILKFYQKVIGLHPQLLLQFLYHQARLEHIRKLLFKREQHLATPPPNLSAQQQQMLKHDGLTNPTQQRTITADIPVALQKPITPAPSISPTLPAQSKTVSSREFIKSSVKYEVIPHQRPDRPAIVAPVIDYTRKLEPPPQRKSNTLVQDQAKRLEPIQPPAHVRDYKVPQPIQRLDEVLKTEKALTQAKSPEQALQREISRVPEQKTAQHTPQQNGTQRLDHVVQPIKPPTPDQAMQPTRLFGKKQLQPPDKKPDTPPPEQTVQPRPEPPKPVFPLREVKREQRLDEVVKDKPVQTPTLDQAKRLEKTPANEPAPPERKPSQTQEQSVARPKQDIAFTPPPIKRDNAQQPHPQERGNERINHLPIDNIENQARRVEHNQTSEPVGPAQPPHEVAKALEQSQTIERQNRLTQLERGRQSLTTSARPSSPQTEHSRIVDAVKPQQSTPSRSFTHHESPHAEHAKPNEHRQEHAHIAEATREEEKRRPDAATKPLEQDRSPAAAGTLSPALIGSYAAAGKHDVAAAPSSSTKPPATTPPAASAASAVPIHTPEPKPAAIVPDPARPPAPAAPHAEPATGGPAIVPEARPTAPAVTAPMPTGKHADPEHPSATTTTPTSVVSTATPAAPAKPPTNATPPTIAVSPNTAPTIGAANPVEKPSAGGAVSGAATGSVQSFSEAPAATESTHFQDPLRKVNNASEGSLDLAPQTILRKVRNISENKQNTASLTNDQAIKKAALQASPYLENIKGLPHQAMTNAPAIQQIPGKKMPGGHSIG